MFTQFLKSSSLQRRAGGLVAALALALGAQAQPQPQGVAAAPAFLGATQRWLDEALAAQRTSDLAPLRIEIAWGALDPRLKLASCAKVEPYIPAGMRLWGKTRLGLRCVEGASRWNVFLPVTIHAYGTAWVIQGPVASGSVLTQADAVEAEVDWAEQSSPILGDPSQWVGHVAARPLSTGQALRQGMTRPAQVFQAGASVRVLAQGAGFQITSDGLALSAGVVGQSARVKMGNGRITSGVVLDSRTVQLAL